MVDNQDELDRIAEISQKKKIQARVLVRLKPEIEAHTHEYIKTGQIDSKFGVDKHELFRLLSRLLSWKRLNF